MWNHIEPLARTPAPGNGVATCNHNQSVSIYRKTVPYTLSTFWRTYMTCICFYKFIFQKPTMLYKKVNVFAVNILTYQRNLGDLWNISTNIIGDLFKSGFLLLVCMFRLHKNHFFTKQRGDILSAWNFFLAFTDHDYLLDPENMHLMKRATNTSHKKIWSVCPQPQKYCKLLENRYYLNIDLSQNEKVKLLKWKCCNKQKF